MEIYGRLHQRYTMHLVWATKEPKVMAELNSMPQKHQQSMKANPKMIQNCDLDTVGPTSNMHAQNTQINLTADPRAHHLQDINIMELIIHKNAMTIEVIITCSLQEPYHSKHCNK